MYVCMYACVCMRMRVSPAELDRKKRLHQSGYEYTLKREGEKKKTEIIIE